MNISSLTNNPNSGSGLMVAMRSNSNPDLSVNNLDKLLFPFDQLNNSADFSTTPINTNATFNFQNTNNYEYASDFQTNYSNHQQQTNSTNLQSINENFINNNLNSSDYYHNHNRILNKKFTGGSLSHRCSTMPENFEEETSLFNSLNLLSTNNHNFDFNNNNSLYSNNHHYHHHFSNSLNTNESFNTYINNTNSANIDHFGGFLGNNYSDTNTSLSSSYPSSSTVNTNGTSSSLNTFLSLDEGPFLGLDEIGELLSKSGTYSDLFDDLPDLEDLMSLVTFESSSSSGASAPPLNNIAEQQQQTNLSPNSKISNDATQDTESIDQNFELMIPDFSNTNSIPPASHNFYDFSNTESLTLTDSNQNFIITSLDQTEYERTTRSAPPSPTPPQRQKKIKPTSASQSTTNTTSNNSSNNTAKNSNNNLPWNKLWNKMDEDERSRIVECMTRIINDEMGLREQLEIIRILNSDVKLKPTTDTQFIIDLKMIDDEKYKRIKDIIKTDGLSFNDKQLFDNSSDYGAANNCPLAKRDLRIKRAQQRLKLKQKKEQRQIIKESKSGLFSKTEVIPLVKVVAEEDIDIDILS